ncbi:MAG: cyclic nucleotide-binding domain-containing protein [Acidobacteriota bacterium]
MAAIEPHTDLETLLELARRLSERELFEEAAELFLVALRLEPANLGIKLGLAEVRKRQAARQGKPPKGLRERLREQHRRNAIDAAQFVGLAHLYAEKGESARAFECLEMARAKDDAGPSRHKLLGRLQFRKKEHEAAAEELQQALRFNPFDRETAEMLGRAELERQQHEHALRATIHAFLLLNEADHDGSDRLRRRIQTLKQILGWGTRELAEMFHERQDALHVAFDRLEWHRERQLEADGLLPRGIAGLGALPRRMPGGQIEVAARLRRIRLLAHLPDELIFKLTRAVEDETFEIGSLIFAHHHEGRDLYLIDEGEVTIQRPTSYGTFVLGTHGVGEMFGEASYVTGHERTGDAIATQATHLLRIDAAALDALIEDSPELGSQLAWILWHALARKLRGTNEQLKGFFNQESQPENFLRLRRPSASGAVIGAIGAVTVDSSDKIRLFREQGLSRRELMTLATFSKEVRYAAGAYVFQEGDQGAEMYVILEGKAMISKFIPGGGEEALAILDRGDFFGEMSLIDGQPRSADARAHGGPLTALALNQATVREVLAMDPHASLEFLQLLCRLIANRLREIDEKVIGWRIMSGERTATA